MGAKWYVYRQIVSQTKIHFPFSHLSLSLVPLEVTVRNIRDFPIQSDSLVSFASVSVRLPLSQLFARRKKIGITVYRPKIVFSDSLWRNRRQPLSSRRFSLQEIDVIDGEVHFRSGDMQATLLHLTLRTSARSGHHSFRLTSPHLRLILPVKKALVTLAGNLEAEAREDGDHLRVNDFIWRTENLLLRLNGKVFKSGSFIFQTNLEGMSEPLLAPILNEFVVHGRVSASCRVSGGDGQPLMIRGDISAPAFRIKEVDQQQLSGSVYWDDLNRRVLLNARFLSAGRRAELGVDTVGGRTTLSLSNVDAAAVTHLLEISGDAPLAGILRRGEIVLDKEGVRATATLEHDAQAALQRQAFIQAECDVHYTYERPLKRKRFQIRRGVASFGTFAIDGTIDGAQHTSDFSLTGDIHDMENGLPVLLYYADLDLGYWNPSRGRGVMTLTIQRRGREKSLAARFGLNQILANGQPLAALEGTVTVAQGLTRGEFTVRSSDLNGQAILQHQGPVTTIDFRDIRGDGVKMLKILKLDLAVKGDIQGDFVYRKEEGQELPVIQGRFRSPRLVWRDVFVADQFACALRTDLDSVELKPMTFLYHGGAGTADILIDYPKKFLKIDGGISAIDLHRMSPDFNGRLDLALSGQGIFLQDPIQVTLKLSDGFYYRGRKFQVAGTGELRTDLSDFALTSEGDWFTDTSHSPWKFILAQKGESLNGSFDVQLNDLNLLIPWTNNQGEMRLQGRLFSDARGDLHTEGFAVFQGPVLSFPNFSHSLNRFQGFVTFQDLNFSLHSLTGEMGKGRLQGNGWVNAGAQGLKEMTLNLNGQGITLYPMDRATCKADVDVALKYAGGQLLLQGTAHILSALWEREITEPISFYTRPELSAAESKMLDVLHFDLKISGDRNITVNNSFGRFDSRLNLQLVGTAHFPVILGTIESSSGDVYFSDRKFAVTRARLIFNNRFSVNPLIAIESESVIGNYGIRFSITGTASHPKPELVSSPPLPPQDILALISLGELFRRPTSTELSSQIGTTSLLSTKLTEEVKRRVNKLLGIDVLRIDPFLSGETTLSSTRLTIGKSISKDLIVIYSTNLATSRQEILYLQYQLSPAIALIGMRNENGRFSFDIRFRQRS